MLDTPEQTTTPRHDGNVSAEAWLRYFTCSLLISLRASMWSFLSCSISSRSSKSDREVCWQEHSRNYFHLRRDPHALLECPFEAQHRVQLSGGGLIIALTACNQLRGKSLLVWHNQPSPTDRYQSNHMMRMDQRGVTSHHSIISIISFLSFLAFSVVWSSVIKCLDEKPWHRLCRSKSCRRFRKPECTWRLSGESNKPNSLEREPLTSRSSSGDSNISWIRIWRSGPMNKQIFIKWLCFCERRVKKVTEKNLNLNTVYFLPWKPEHVRAVRCVVNVRFLVWLN